MRSSAVTLALALLAGCANNSGLVWTGGAPLSNCSTQNLWEQQTDAWLQTQPDIHLVFWGSYWLNAGSSEANFYSVAWSTLANDPAFYKPLQEYGIQRGQLEGIYYTNPNIVAGTPSDFSIQKELALEIDNGQLPAPDSMSMYVLMFPPSTVPSHCSTPDDKCSAFHGVGFGQYTYQAINYSPNPTSNNRGVAISHEIYESATDPDGNGYWAGYGESEVGDYCNGNPYTLDGYQIQQVWSQDSCQCIPVVPDAG